ncbi:hypothetical protein EJ05DRAFT_334021 [Pseudovirgaria hyperparasitica]|uniref:Uncharacterized protein n=1 Tax=Pseudovirgaria hyperparasitica TaxID=470096 RepID=A0A6A6W8C7_9PEZI|nr:uncharacterized protein EJ05DRAFT_334021 [Pseudovirgaria hyperparasitica]KAF2759138.1 hypothetical protein EJ05DRAFT_334021 [Pseudovirgaria hyperparasitica]
MSLYVLGSVDDIAYLLGNVEDYSLAIAILIVTITQYYTLLSHRTVINDIGPRSSPSEQKDGISSGSCTGRF